MRKVLDQETLKAGVRQGAKLADRGMTLAEDTVKIGKGLLFWLKIGVAIGLLLIGVIVGAIAYSILT